MKIGINLKIDVSKIDKNRLFKGQKGTYLDATTFVDLDQLDEYGNNGFIAQQVSEDERKQGVKGEILGNSTVFWRGEGQARPQQAQPQQAPSQATPADDFDDDIPF